MLEQSNPVAVLISDIHFNVSTLPLAEESLSHALRTASTNNLPLVIAGDLHDTKAMLRGECVNSIINILSGSDTPVYIIPGNHCMINEKSDRHSLEFLKPYSHVIDTPQYVNDVGAWLIPYQTNPDKFEAILNTIPKGSRIICHQGVLGADMGHYIQDKTALSKDIFADYRVISGHYHRRQDIKCGRPRRGAVGLFSYIGNPYTLSYGEADHPSKGYQILMSDGSLVHVPLGLRKHDVIELNVDQINNIIPSWHSHNDILWFKIHGKQSELNKVKKKDLACIIGHMNFKLDLIPTKGENKAEGTKKLPVSDTLDNLIERIDETGAQKIYLKALWRELLGETS